MDTLASSDHVIVVGAGLAGWRFVEALRREGCESELTLIGDEVDAPWARRGSLHGAPWRWIVGRWQPRGDRVGHSGPAIAV